MKKVFWLMASLALPLTLFSGCAFKNKLLVNVDSLTARTLPAAKTYVLLPGNRDTSASDLQFQEYSTYIHRVLQAKGYTQAETVESASLAVFLSYGIGDPQTHQYSYSVPVWGQTGVSSATTLGTLNTYGNHGTFSGTTYYTPSYGITGYATRTGTYTTHLRFLVMEAYDLQRFRNSKEEVQLWKTTVTSTGSSGDLRRIFPILVAATKPYIGTNTGKKVEVVLREDDQRVLEIKNPEGKNDHRTVDGIPSFQQAAIQNKIDPVKHHATLRHTKGLTLTIPPQTLQAEYMDTGEGHGPARVFYPNNAVLDGEYRTIASGENFKGLVNARLIDPDKVANFPNSNLRGFVSFAGSDGTVLECVYAATGPSGNGRGSCMDNRGNQYELSF